MASFVIPQTTLPPGTYPSAAFAVPQGTARIGVQLDLVAADRVDPAVIMAGAVQTASSSNGPWTQVFRNAFTGASNCPVPGPHYTVGVVAGETFVRGQLEVLGRTVTIGATMTTT